MKSLGIAIWYNAKTSQMEDFAVAIVSDLQKCLNRFGVQADFSINTKTDNAAYNIAIIASDNAENQIVEEFKNFSQSSKTIALTLGPIADGKLLNYNSIFHFWDKIYATGEVRFYRRNNPETRLSYWEKVTDLATELSKSLIESSLQNKGVVYISQNDVSNGAERDNLIRDLNDLGFEVVPNKPFSKNLAECTAQIEQALNKAQLIIHIIPPIYSTFFVQQHLSITEHQCSVSAEFVKKKPNTQRVIWIPTSYEISDEENQVFIEKIQRDKDQTNGTTVLKSSIEDLKKLYRNIILSTSKREDGNTETDIYMIFDSENDHIHKKCTEILSSKSPNIASNQFGITYNQHISRLASARMVVLSYSKRNEKWLSVKANDILKARGMETYKPFEKVVFLNSNKQITEKLPEVFTHFLNDVNDLETID
jgi:hypothetical protein